MVQAVGQGGPSGARGLLSSFRTSDLVGAFLASRMGCIGGTMKHYRWALIPFQKTFDMLPTPKEIIDFVYSLDTNKLPSHRLPPASMRSYYNDLRTFYHWLKENHRGPLPDLPYESFSRKRPSRRSRV